MTDINPRPDNGPGETPVAGAAEARFAHVPGDRALGVRLSRVLRSGLLIAVSLIIAGLVWQTVANGFTMPRPSFGQFDSTRVEYRSLAQTLRGLAALRADALLQLGVIAIIAIPSVRVAWLLIAMASRRERFYAAVCVAVLAVLVYGIVAG